MPQALRNFGSEDYGLPLVELALAQEAGRPNVPKGSELTAPARPQGHPQESALPQRKKRDRLPGNGDDRDRPKFLKALSCMLLLDDKAPSKNQHCRRPFKIAGVKTTSFL